MKKIDPGQVITILANVGVIAGIAFLAIEINQSNQLARSQTRSDISDRVVGFTHLLASDAELYELYSRGRQEPDSLTEVERGRLFTLWGGILRTWENIHYQYRNGLFDDSEFSVEREVWRMQTQSPFFVELYCQVREQLSREFTAEIDSLMSSSDCAESAVP